MKVKFAQGLNYFLKIENKGGGECSTGKTQDYQKNMGMNVHLHLING